MFYRFGVVTRLGMAHTCYENYCFDGNIRTVTPDELSELQDEDIKAGFVSRLAHFIDECAKLEAKHVGSFNKILALWWSYLDGVLL